MRSNRLHPLGSARFSTGLLLALLLSLVLAGGARPRTAQALPAVPTKPDFNGDGYADLAIGAPGEDLDGLESAGVVHVLNGSASGIWNGSNDLLSQGEISSDAADDRFGAVLAVGNFNGDGYADLAIGVPNRDIGIFKNVGVIHVLYGSWSGLAISGSQSWHEDYPNIPGSIETNDRFGESLTAGDFNKDGYGDLAIGAPGEVVSGAGHAGAVYVLYGTTSGLSSTNNQLWTQDSSGISGTSEDQDRLGAEVLAGDFNGDGYSDLAVGAPGEAVASLNAAGAVNVLYGSSSRLSSTNNQRWTQDDGLGSAEAGDEFGAELAAGDFNKDGYIDLAIGAPKEDVGSEVVFDAGAVNVLYGTSSRLSSTNAQTWTQNSSGITDSAESGDMFGYTLRAGDFNGDGYADLGIGVPYEDIETLSPDWDIGAVHVLYGSSSRLSSTNSQRWTQDSADVLGAGYQFDYFGMSLFSADFDQDGYGDLAIGVPSDQSPDGQLGVGSAQIMYGTASRLSALDNQLWSQDSSAIWETGEIYDGFGGGRW